MNIRKLKVPAHGAKIEAFHTSSQKPGKFISEEMRMSLSKTISTSQKIIPLKQSRSNSVLKQKFSQMLSANATPLNKKPHNEFYTISTSSDIIDSSTVPKSLNDSKHNILSSINTILSEKVKTCKNSLRYLVYIEALEKLGTYDSNLKKILATIIVGIKDCFKVPEDLSQIPAQSEIETEKYRSQIAELRNTIKTLLDEKKTFKKSSDQFNSILGYMKKQGVPVEMHIQEFYEKNNKKDKKNLMSLSMKTIQICNGNDVKPSIIPKLNIVPPSGSGFHQEFMAKVEEFSESWRELIKNEKSG
ncbi:hypothetical protein SteCoe_27543 [Stentor coeruleus]|uniref:Uncharacterized protein n=1 Tax=Stentor coeruleus TaxID=5963 RepID=A0A1R2BAS4_9CILI|nr:hypothetical protein SteCoe_27543 [Stentor coeruleus]